MALRIAGNQPPPGALAPPPPVETVSEEAPPELMEQEEAVSEPAAMPMESHGKVSPQVARYLTSDQGPFICANCQHFMGEDECEVVSGPIDPEGVCILFTPPEGGGLEGVAEDVEPVEESELPESEEEAV